jgi:hypothetical protein
MTRRVIIDSTAASPFRVSVAGVDVLTAEFNDLIFDGNQSPLRLLATGWVVCPAHTWNEYTFGKNMNEASGPTYTLAGKPVFLVAGRVDDGLGNLTTTFARPGAAGSGHGGAFCSGTFIGVSFQGGAPAVPDAAGPNTLCNYAIFKNYV